VNMILLHYTVFDTLERTIRHFQKSTSGVSAHYIIGRDGKVVQMVRDEDEAFHAGKSHWKGEKSCNRFSIGVELVNEGRQRRIVPFTKEQYESLIILCRKLTRKYSIPPERIIGHSDVAIPTGRKRDPGAHFDWECLAQRGIGRMPEPPHFQYLPSSSGSGRSSWKNLCVGMKGVEVRRLQRGLKRIGYKIPVNGVFDRITRKVVKAFQLHYRRQNVSGEIDLETMLRVRSLIEK